MQAERLARVPTGRAGVAGDVAGVTGGVVGVAAGVGADGCGGGAGAGAGGGGIRGGSTLTTGATGAGCTTGGGSTLGAAGAVSARRICRISRSIVCSRSPILPSSASTLFRVRLERTRLTIGSTMGRATRQRAMRPRNSKLISYRLSGRVTANHCCPLRSLATSCSFRRRASANSRAASPVFPMR